MRSSSVSVTDQARWHLDSVVEAALAWSTTHGGGFPDSSRGLTVLAEHIDQEVCGVSVCFAPARKTSIDPGVVHIMAKLGPVSQLILIFPLSSECALTAAVGPTEAMEAGILYYFGKRTGTRGFPLMTLDSTAASVGRTP